MGASLDSGRYSNKAIRKLRQSKKEVVAFGSKSGTILDVTIDTELKQYDHIHTVSLYLHPKNQQFFYEYLIKLKPQRIIFNPGTENLDLITFMEEIGIRTEVACTLVLLTTNQY